MSVEIRVPTLGESVTEATVARWLKSVGDAVKRDEPLVELETDKISLEVTAGEAGQLSEVLAKQGDTVEVGALLGRIADGAAGPAPKLNGNGHDSSKAAPVVAAEPADALMPAVRKLIEENGLDASTIKGTGPGGRILKGDVLAAIEAKRAPAKPTPAPTPVATVVTPPVVMKHEGGAREERVPMSRLRKRVAERLKQAQNTAAILTTFNEADMSAVIAARNAYKDGFEKKHGVKLGFMSFFVKASIQALREISAVNAEIAGDEIVYKQHYDIGVALSAPQGLVVPVLREADRMSFADIEKAIVSYGTKARENKLAIEDLTGGTFTITNGGIFGSMLSTPILNPPQVGILGMHKIQERPVAIAGKVEVRPMMYLALSYDHRLIDGREAVTFLVRIKECLEDPQRLLLEM
ncbi:MAG: 2-oxoglutarate dehydrogenase complex dihydrolipoyllysine-residue succinyltransferase [Alphaproteobacteria bacterium]|nr:2-oxoglutarate dehydrogenase complex dihydrolipoyllysine-residue succinyltransferase [Alphaproteobacteria bacterium]